MFGRPLHFAIVGPSGAGKTTAVETLKAQFPGLKLQKQNNYATRKMRKKELTDGSDYIHIGVEEYLERKGRGEFIGYKEGEGLDDQGTKETQNYGGAAPELNKTVFITDPTGLNMLRHWAQKHQEEIVAIFFNAASDTCHQRMVNERGETVAQSRTKQYDLYMQGRELCDYEVDANRGQEYVAEALYTILSNEIMAHSVH